MMQSRIEMISPAALRAWAKNARTHSKKQLKQIAESIRAFGFTNPVLVDRENTILAGHGRVEAAKLIGMTEVPCIRLEHMTTDQKRAYVLADNKLALNAGWDDQLLAEELKALLEVDLDFDVEITGFSISEIDSLVEGLIPEEPGDPDNDAIPPDGPARARLGDIFALGPHRLICGSALDPHVVAALMDGAKAEMVFTDPPYNVPIDGHVGAALGPTAMIVVGLPGGVYAWWLKGCSPGVPLDCKEQVGGHHRALCRQRRGRQAAPTLSAQARFVGYRNQLRGRVGFLPGTGLASWRLRGCCSEVEVIAVGARPRRRRL